jgi:phosphoribosylaminoimidazole-succinocarboxamide synthase
MTAPETLQYSNIQSLPLVSRGKVRDIYDVDEHHLLIVTTDRLSAFDCILPDPIPGKGRVLTSVSNFWFQKLSHLIPNQQTQRRLRDAIPDPKEADLLEGRGMIVRKLSPLPIEAVVRGYLIGSAWKDYQASGGISGIELKSGLRQAERLDEVLFTPSTKAAQGQHDENINYDQTIALLGQSLADKVRSTSLALYREAAFHAESRGIIIADTKFEFGLDADGELHLIDEVLTPDSSRFWPQDSYQVGSSPPSFDKQFVRDYLETLDWNKQPPAPTLPLEIIQKTAAKYLEAEERLTY